MRFAFAERLANHPCLTTMFQDGANARRRRQSVREGARLVMGPNLCRTGQKRNTGRRETGIPVFAIDARTPTDGLPLNDGELKHVCGGTWSNVFSVHENLMAPPT